jgi:CheY-like chemotaxis protein
MTRSGTVMIIDDDVSIREAIGAVLEDEGYLVVCAENGRRALEVLREIPPPDLLLLDLMMPVMNGWEFLSALEADRFLCGLPVVVVSAVANEPPVGANRCIRKPIDLPALLALLDTIDRCRKPN